MSYDFYSPTGVCNEAISAAGSDYVIGDISEGSDVANVCLRLYAPSLQQMLRTAGWNFARKFAPLTLVADASGQTENVGTRVPSTNFIYAYAWATDCAFFRYIPWNPWVTPATPSGNIVPPDPDAPLMTGLGQQPDTPRRIWPARFMVTSDVNNLEDGASNLQPGSSPIGRTVICTNVKDAHGIYTFNATYPNLWSSHFREALVAYLAAQISMGIHKADKKTGMAMRAQNIAIAKDKIKQARVTDGREGWHNSDNIPDWMRFRAAGGYGFSGSWNNIGIGDWNCAYDGIAGGLGNSSSY